MQYGERSVQCNNDSKKMSTKTNLVKDVRQLQRKGLQQLEAQQGEQGRVCATDAGLCAGKTQHECMSSSTLSSMSLKTIASRHG